MDATEAKQLIDKAREIDNNFGAAWGSEEVRAKMWAEILFDITLEDAIKALKDHYRNNQDVFMPASVRKYLEKRWSNETFKDGFNIDETTPGPPCSYIKW